MATLANNVEKFPSKVSARFDDRSEAEAARDRVTRQAGVDKKRIRIVEPADPALGRKLEPESRGIARLLVWSHVTLGIAGVGSGILIALVMIALDVSLFSRNPGYTLAVLAFFGAIAGLLLAGFISLRPDHDRMIVEVTESADAGYWHVVVHARNRHEERLARDVLRGLSYRVTGTL